MPAISGDIIEIFFKEDITAEWFIIVGVMITILRKYPEIDEAVFTLRHHVVIHIVIQPLVRRRFIAASSEEANFGTGFQFPSV